MDRLPTGKSLINLVDGAIDFGLLIKEASEESGIESAIENHLVLVRKQPLNKWNVVSIITITKRTY